MPRDSVRATWCQRANRSRSCRLSHWLRIPSAATSSRYQAGMRTPRRMRASGIALRKLIRSRSVAAEALSSTERRRFRRPQPMVVAAATAPVAHFESALDRPVIQSGLGQTQQRTLNTDSELGVIVMDQLAQFTVIGAAETFLSHSRSNCSQPICWNSSTSLPWLSPMSRIFMPVLNRLLTPANSYRFHCLNWIG